jgi:hypothetical protein
MPFDNDKQGAASKSKGHHYINLAEIGYDFIVGTIECLLHILRILDLKCS